LGAPFLSPSATLLHPLPSAGLRLGLERRQHRRRHCDRQRGGQSRKREHLAALAMGPRTIELARVRITDAGRRVLGGR
jgi:hypothetical protein